MKTKLNLKKKALEKINMTVSLYTEDKQVIDSLAESLGISTSMLVRSLINDIIEGKIKIEV